jgi:hypothetical protein
MKQSASIPVEQKLGKSARTSNQMLWDYTSSANMMERPMLNLL